MWEMTNMGLEGLESTLESIPNYEDVTNPPSNFGGGPVSRTRPLNINTSILVHVRNQHSHFQQMIVSN